MVEQTYPVSVVRWHWYDVSKDKMLGLGMLSFHPSHTAARNYVTDFTINQVPDRYVLVEKDKDTLYVTPSTFDGLQSQGTAFVKKMGANPNHH